MFTTKLILVWLLDLSIEPSPAPDECSYEKPWHCRGGTIDPKDFKLELPDIARSLSESDWIPIEHKKIAIPEEFDARTRWPRCKSIPRILNQGVCGICWAVCSAMSSSDRVCIASAEKDQFEYSIKDLVECCDSCYKDPNSSRCHQGASLPAGMLHIVNAGAVSSICKPFNETEFARECRESCVDPALPYAKDKRRISSERLVVGGTTLSTSIGDIQVEILKNGPLCARIERIPADLAERYTDGVYVANSSDAEGVVGHAVRIIGWGTDEGVPYWLCANSWGRNWGNIGGFFKIRRGTNELRIEDYFMAVDTSAGHSDTSKECLHHLLFGNLMVFYIVNFLRELENWNLFKI